MAKPASIRIKKTQRTGVWIFRANPDDFDIDGYLARSPAKISWLVNQHSDLIEPGDTVFLWRNQGKKAKAEAGVVAEGVIASYPEVRPDDADSESFYRPEFKAQATTHLSRVFINILRIADKRHCVKRAWIEEDPVLSKLPNVVMAAGTNYVVPASMMPRLRALWENTGRDFTRNESLACLYLYDELRYYPI